MTPREHYQARLDRWARVGAAESRRATVLSRMRLTTFLGGVVLAWWGISHGSVAAAIAGALSIGAFAVLVARHARVLDRVACAEAAGEVNAQGLCRLDRNWTALTDTPAPPAASLERHPYARDLDLFGHASLARWLGRSATPYGTRTLWEWLLTPGTPAEITARQQAVQELATDAGWREALAVEGRLTRDDRGGLARFVAWAEGDPPPISGIPALRLVIPSLTLAIWILLLAQIAGVLGSPWWLLPVIIGAVCSFAYAGRIYAAFDRASAGDRVLPRYATMLGLVRRPAWRAAELVRIQQQVASAGGASRSVRVLSRIIQWSELRRAAALLHFPIQALTLWDFHVLFALERWRDRSGPSVRRWLDALGEVDALAILAAVRHDCPAWSFPEIDPSARSCIATGLAHPLIPDDRRVGNDLEIGPPGTMTLVTGSNMSGKSTLLRAVGLNAVLAQAGAPVCAASLTLPPVALHTSIRVQDSLELGLSYFMAALATLKRIVDAAETRRPDAPLMLYLLDEILQGTNSAERAIAVRGVSRHLLQAGAIGVMTTHDLSIAEAEPLASSARLVHFTEQVHEDGTMSFDYRLRPGLAASRNAIRLMQLIGIQP